MTEQEYLDMAKHFKEELEKKDLMLRCQQVAIEDLKKILMTAYGFVRVIDHFSTEEEIAGECKETFELLRGYLSMMLDEYIL